MLDGVRKQVEQLAAELLREASDGTVVLMTVSRGKVRVYLIDNETAVLLEHVGRCSECCKVAGRRARDEERW